MASFISGSPKANIDFFYFFFLFFGVSAYFDLQSPCLCLLSLDKKLGFFVGTILWEILYFSFNSLLSEIVGSCVLICFGLDISDCLRYVPLSRVHPCYNWIYTNGKTPYLLNQLVHGDNCREFLVTDQEVEEQIFLNLTIMYFSSGGPGFMVCEETWIGS